MTRRSPCQIAQWWTRQLRRDASKGIAAWRQDPERPLLIVGALLFASFLLHWLGYMLAKHRIGWPHPIFSTPEWEGRTGWRKPLVFGISNAMLFVSLRQALRVQQLVPRSLVAHLAAWSTAAEVGLITLQSWRDVPSHFNTATSLDAALYGAKLVGVGILSVSCIMTTVGVFRRLLPGLPATQVIALRHGLALLCVSIAIGIAQVVYGHLPREQQEMEDLPCLAATAGARAAPCYEIHGKAIVKLAHFLPLHVTEVLLALSWLANHTNFSFKWQTVLLRIAACGCWSLTVLGIWATFRGHDLKHPPPMVAVAALFAMASILFPGIVAFFGIPAGGHKGDCVDNASQLASAMRKMTWYGRCTGC